MSKYGSKSIRSPFELWQDAGADLSRFAEKRIAMRIGRIRNRELTAGIGSTVVTDPGYGTEAIGIVAAADLGRIGAVWPNHHRYRWRRRGSGQ